jgi:prepilin peptidase CpaA
VISVATDVLQRRILDVVTVPTFALALAVRGYKEGFGDFERGVLSGLVSAFGASMLFVLLAWRGGFGWGDVKLMAAVGAAFGYPTVMAALIFISLAGALQAVVTLMWQGEGGATLRRMGERWLAKLRKAPVDAAPRKNIPYGVAIALGSFWAMWWESTSGSAN